MSPMCAPYHTNGPIPMCRHACGHLHASLVFPASSTRAPYARTSLTAGPMPPWAEETTVAEEMPLTMEVEVVVAAVDGCQAPVET
mmetsp:Transcript_148163/g.376535  ORF Transcript_148163/g.376535 Transcript_148163/m.376535 type:complete len:85 (+) Transcript_148163:114-368(+)